MVIILQFPNTLNQYKINLYGTNSYGFGIAGGTLMYSSQSNHSFYNSGNNVNTFTIDSVGNTSCIGTLTASGKIYANSGIISTNAAEWTSGGLKGVIFRSGYDVPNNNNYNCSILTYDHLGDGFCDGLSINAYDGISFCTGANTRSERMRISSGGRVGIQNTNPQSYLHLGNCEVANSAPVIVFGKNVNGTGFRNAFIVKIPLLIVVFLFKTIPFILILANIVYTPADENAVKLKVLLSLKVKPIFAGCPPIVVAF